MGYDETADTTTMPPTAPQNSTTATTSSNTNNNINKPEQQQQEKPVKDDDTVLEDNEAFKESSADEATTSMAKKNSTTIKKLLNLRFLFANRDGLSVSIHCDPTDTVGQVKGALISLWPEELPACSDGDELRLICMGKGFLTPDSMTLAELEIPSFKTHATPINVSIKRGPESISLSKQHHNPKFASSSTTTASNAIQTSSAASAQGCGCVIQ